MRPEPDFRAAAVVRIAEEMALAARTAPKAKGIDLLEIVVLQGDDILKLSAGMKAIGERENHPTFLRDCENVKAAQAVLLIATRRQTIGLRYCSFCGQPDCAAAEKHGVNCVFNGGDLGIAIGSAVAVAADRRVDNRIMYTAGKAAIEAKMLGPEITIALGIPLSVSSKSPFFDRK
ncbi:MAG: DUF2148 domain-containing protein [Candidatus Margulisbacteria bacterium]|jgi:uncharacterized ferredoxin-like protein|nr:DUF2148 domain-containing protein [Candidatus Margulisiibacteriota bacterium]